MHSGNRLKAAVELGISRCYLHRLLNQFNLAEEESAQEALDVALLEEFDQPQAQRKRLTAGNA